MDPNYLRIRASGALLRAFSGLVAGEVAPPQPLDIDHLAAVAHLGQRAAPLGRVGIGKLEPEGLLLGLDGGTRLWSFRQQPASYVNG